VSFGVSMTTTRDGPKEFMPRAVGARSQRVDDAA